MKIPPAIAVNKSEQIIQLTGILKNSQSTVASKKITAGYDGFIDSIVKIIRNKQKQKPNTLFKTIGAFGAYITEKAGASLSLELEEISVKLGGNMPNLANALGRLGATVNCVGALGYPQMHPVFKTLPRDCHLYSFAEPGAATAFEFTDGKIMFAQIETLNQMGWNKIKNIIGIDTLIRLYQESHLFCLVNWSEIDASTGIWEGLLQDVLPQYAIRGEKQIAFFDLSDCSKRSNESISHVLTLLTQFQQYTKVILGLNKNEAAKIHRVLFGKKADKNLQYLGEDIFKKLNIDELVLHSSKEAFAFSKEGSFVAPGFFIKDPAMSTGAGDNFNAGFCIAKLLQLDPGLSLMF
ncbi:MAG TPA: hypothetical protein VK543_17910, partial [Puia sp.]|nr:hypothetical protein [Puia sp.]